MTLSVIDDLVMGEISQHVGIVNAISLKTLAADTGLSERVVRDSIKRLVEDYGYPIGSSSYADLGGYFILSSEEERTSAMRTLISRIESLTKRVSSLAKVQLVGAGA